MPSEKLGRLPVDRRTALVSLAAVLATAACSSDVRRDARSGPATPFPTGHPSQASPLPRGQQAPPADPGLTTDPSPEPAIARTTGPDIVNGPRSRSEVALTFHGAGDRSLTEQVLQDCADHEARITVFAVGKWLAGTPALGPRILAAGHELGNHTWSHQQMPALSPGAALVEIRRGADALRASTGSVGWWFRPSGTPHSTAAIRAAASSSGYQRCVSYDVDPEDYLDPGSAKVVSRTLEKVRPGSIISLHLGHAGTVTALPRILAGLSVRGLRPVTLSRLLRD
jgi:peptidoglycan/xylan/chitin deacetylase (PgdA/CDA1 family)